MSPRGNGNNDLLDVIVARDLGNFAGVAADESLPEIVVASGTFACMSAGNPVPVNIDTSGYANAVLLGGIRSRNAANAASVNYTPSALQQNNSVAGNDPIVVFNGLGFPEPATAGVLGFILMLGGRRWRGI